MWLEATPPLDSTIPNADCESTGGAAWNGRTSTTSLVFPSSNDCVHSLLQPIGEPAPLFASKSLVTHYSTQKHQEQGTAALEITYSHMHSVLLTLSASSLHTDDAFFKYIDPRLLSITHRTNNTALVTCHTSTISAQLDPGLFSPPTTAPLTSLNHNHTVATPTDRHTPPPIAGAPAHITTHASRPASSHGDERVRHQASSLYHKKRRAKALVLEIGSLRRIGRSRHPSSMPTRCIAT